MDIRKPIPFVLILAMCGQLRAFAASTGDLRLTDGTPITVRLMEPLSSATAAPGDLVSFEVVDDVIVDGQVFIKQGTPARGTVVQAVAKRRMGRSGTLEYALLETKSVDRQTVKLRATQLKRGGNNVAATAIATGATAVFLPVAAPAFLLLKGKDVSISPGTRVIGFVDGDHVMKAALPEEPVEPRYRSTTPLTNGDVIRLLKVGLGDDVVIAKIRGSSAAFSLDTADLVSLKRAGATDRVIQAMLQESQRQ